MKNHIILTQLIKRDIIFMLKDFNVPSDNKYYKELNNYNWFILDFPLINAWFCLLSQYIPVRYYHVFLSPNCLVNLSVEQLESVKRMKSILENGQNINDLKMCFLPSLKFVDKIDLLYEQSNIKHFHIPINGIRGNQVIFGKINFINQSIYFEDVATHETMHNHY